VDNRPARRKTDWHFKDLAKQMAQWPFHLASGQTLKIFAPKIFTLKILAAALRIIHHFGVTQGESHLGESYDCCIQIVFRPAG
jgi:hypothetical protein